MFGFGHERVNAQNEALGQAREICENNGVPSGCYRLPLNGVYRAQFSCQKSSAFSRQNLLSVLNTRIPLKHHWGVSRDLPVDLQGFLWISLGKNVKYCSNFVGVFIKG